MIGIPSESMKKLSSNLSLIGRELLNKVDKLDSEIDRHLGHWGNEIRNTIIRSMRETPRDTTKIYGRQGHHPSREGHPPAIDTGELIRSIIYNVRNMSLEVGSAGGGKYSIWLEEGTENMEARPFLEPAVDRHFRSIIADISHLTKNTITKAIQKGAD